MNNELMHTNEMRQLGAEELGLVAGGGSIEIGPVHLDYSEGSHAVGIGIGDTGVYIGPNGAGWYSGESYGQVKF